MENRDMTVVEHLAELRKRIIWTLLFFVVAMFVGFAFSGTVVDYLKANTIKDLSDLNAFGPADALRVYVQVSFLLAFTLTLPFLLFQIWRFVRPGLKPRERKVTLSFIPFAVFLFLLGMGFAYFVVFPFLLRFMSTIAGQMGITEMYGISQYFRFMFNIVFPIGLLFELPVVVMFLTSLGILNPGFLAKGRKVAYLLLVVVAAMITPPEIISNILVSIPLIVLYEFSVWLSRMIYRRKQKKEAEFYQSES